MYPLVKSIFADNFESGSRYGQQEAANRCILRDITYSGGASACECSLVKIWVA